MTISANRPRLAAALCLAAMGLFGLIDNFVRLAAETGGLWQFHFLRAVVALSVLLVVAKVTRARLRPLRPWNVLGRSVLNSVAMVIYFGCLGFMPISQVVAGLFTAPIWTVIFSVLFFGEKVGPRRIFAVVLGFAGAVAALRPSGDISIVTFIPVIAGAVYAMGNIATRRWCEGEGTLTLLGAFFAMIGIWGAIGVGVLHVFPQEVAAGGDGFVFRGWVAPVGIFGVMILIQGLGSLLGVGLTIRAYQLADATFVSVFENTLLVFATLWAIILFAEVPDLSQTIGLILIAASGIIIAVRSDSPQLARAATLAE